MAVEVLRVIPKAGRSYKVDANGPSDVSMKYQVTLSEPIAITDLPTSFSGIPAIGAEHPNRPGYYVQDYEVEQPDGASKATLDVTVKYGPVATTVIENEQHEPIDTERITAWGWDDGTSEKELTHTAETTPKPVVNSAGDPFDTVPTYTVPTPTFTKTVQYQTRKTFAPYMCTTNSQQLTIGNVICDPGTLLCSVRETLRVGEAYLPYEYTISLRYRSNIIPAQNGGNAKEIGWDCAVVDAGMREINPTTKKLQLIQVKSAETGKPAAVTAPELLDGHGYHATRDAQGKATPTILEFQAYKRTAFPQWFYSEPPIPAIPNSSLGD